MAGGQEGRLSVLCCVSLQQLCTLMCTHTCEQLLNLLAILVLFIFLSSRGLTLCVSVSVFVCVCDDVKRNSVNIVDVMFCGLVA